MAVQVSDSVRFNNVFDLATLASVAPVQLWKLLNEACVDCDAKELNPCLKLLEWLYVTSCSLFTWTWIPLFACRYPDVWTVLFSTNIERFVNLLIRVNKACCELFTYVWYMCWRIFHHQYSVVFKEKLLNRYVNAACFIP